MIALFPSRVLLLLLLFLALFLSVFPSLLVCFFVNERSCFVLIITFFLFVPPFLVLFLSENKQTNKQKPLVVHSPLSFFFPE